MRVSYDDAVRAAHAVLGPAFKRSGMQEGQPRFNGPCPICAGKDRFRVAQGASAVLIQCSQGCTYGELLEALGLASRDGSSAPRGRAAAARTPTRNPWLNDVWLATAPADGTPGARYLVDHRSVWLLNRPLPAAVRWLPTTAAASLRVRRDDWPTPAAGCLVYRLATPGEADTWALKVEAITEDGRAVPFEMGGKRPSLSRSFNDSGRRTFHACGDPDRGVHLVEGPLDALALMTLADLGRVELDGCAVLGADGIGGFTARACLGRGPVTLYPDGAQYDSKRELSVPKAEYTATLLADALERTGRGRVRIVRQSRGRDLANLVHDELSEKDAIRRD